MKVGEVAGVIAGNGYRYIRIDGQIYLAHRLVWLMAIGEWPDQELDHIDGDRLNNRIANLRLATSSQNSCNGKLRSTNSSGLKGVSWDRTKHKWQATITKEGKQMHLGRYTTKEEAFEAYQAAALRLHGEFANMGVG